MRSPGSPTPREVRRLASDHDFVLDAQPAPRRLGWWAFVATHLSLPAALCAGAIFVVVAIVYTSATSRQLLECPAWAVNCNKADDWTIDHLGTIQGIITLVFSIGMAALAYVALTFCEAAAWPLLSEHLFTIRGLEAYLSTTRGSIIAAPVALVSAKDPATGCVLAAAVAVTLIPLVAAPLIGYAYTPTLQSVELESSYTPGGGIRELYAQTDPPTSVIVGVLAEYNSWAADPPSEPLPAYREWYVDRETLGERGSFSARALRLQTSVSCSSRQVQQVNRDGVWWNAFETNMTRTSNKNNSAEVWVRPVPQLALWADGFEFVSARRTKTTLVFAALNGSIDGGSWTPVVLGSGIGGASAVACEVDIEAIDGAFLTTNAASDNSNADDLAVLSSADNLELSDAAAETRINEMLLWFTAAPLLAGSSVDGTQPMFFNSTATNLPVAYTTSGAERNTWTAEGIDTFIRMAVGALAQATSRTRASSSSSSPPATTTLKSAIPTKKLDPSRAMLLILLPGLVVALGAAVAWWTAATHARNQIPVMRLAGPGELLKSAQTGWLRGQAGTDAAKTYLPHELGALEVRYGVDKDGIAGLARSTRPFNGHRRVEFEMVQSIAV
ncbi:hypothetical protein B0T26DRAFT_648529 [Lasiosphaeria miniovina]|uniref:Uncharacterized protein n=1 Tax=Lasiosphaeria miniovina TaxID=1954250 RepID=A0AA40DRD4_9PEZI|nr:uncharacterized protein B0T26DRAFT_648529 [Lasiosphaeria miniovina]KAK0712745.1 hypothetical protein B0T26DRAFT_648529 [Lasiosphaeria miniovina]